VPGRWAAARGAGTALRGALRAEWAKQATLGGPAWGLATTALLTVAASAAVSAVTRCPAGEPCGVDPARVSLGGVQVGQLGVVVFAVTALTTEYSTGLIAVTLAAVPQRWALFAAKVVTVVVPVLVTGAIAVAGSLFVGWLLLPGRGLSPARGLPALTLSDPAVARAAGGTILYLALVALLAFGVATVIRDTAVAVGGVLGLLYLFPIVAAAVGDPRWARWLQRAGPMTAGLRIQATVGLAGGPISPWGGLGVLAAWAGAALLIGAVVLRLRDA
jgi:ABC-2 type transport system permease protein